MNEGNHMVGFRLRHRIAHIAVSLTVILISGITLFGHITNRQWAIVGTMSLNAAICLLLLATLELFEAFNLKM